MNLDIKKLQLLKKFSNNINVLYVEDNLDAREATYNTLKEFFSNITLAIDGKDGLEKFQESSFELVISDINMPKMNGIEMISKIKEIDQDVAVLIISANTQSDFFLETIRLGVEGYLLKPTELNQFLSVLSKTIEKIQFKKEYDEYHQNLEITNKKLNENIKQQVYKDYLTDLPNRFALEKKISKNQDNYINLHLIDINNFRKINEMYGFENGNSVLKEITTLLKDYTEKEDLELFKVSADEFAILKFSSDYNLKCLYERVEDIIQQINNKKLFLDDGKVEMIINITIGLALDKKNALTKATSALEQAKQNNKKYVLYSKDETGQEELENLFHWQKEINHALSHDNIIPFFQAIYDKNKKILKYEVLMRMRKIEEQKIKYISPFFFLDISIKTKQYDQLSYRIIQKALDAARKNSDKNFSINLGYRDIKNEDVKLLISNYIKESQRSNKPCNLIFEIVESEDITDYNVVKKFFTSFGCKDLQVAIDDFGSGYSNFSNILEIMPEYLKIDGSLIKDIDKNDDMFTLTKAIISFAKKLHIKTIAEFVHNNEIFEMLKGEDVDEFQGFYLGEPKELF